MIKPTIKVAYFGNNKMLKENVSIEQSSILALNAHFKMYTAIRNYENEEVEYMIWDLTPIYELSKKNNIEPLMLNYTRGSKGIILNAYESTLNLNEVLLLAEKLKNLNIPIFMIYNKNNEETNNIIKDKKLNLALNLEEALLPMYNNFINKLF
jgi:Fe2+ transport system protein B